MRLTLLAFVLLPVAASAQSVAEQVPLENSQSCALGMVWDQASQSCQVSDESASPIQNLPDRHNCGGAPRTVTS